MPQKIEYRFLQKVEWPRVKRIFEQLGAFLPDPEMAQIAIADLVDTDEEGSVITRQIQAVLGMQLVPYAGPFWIRDGANVNYQSLKNKADELYGEKMGMKEDGDGRGKFVINGYIGLTSDERIIEMAVKSGMTLLPCKVLLQTWPESDADNILGQKNVPNQCVINTDRPAPRNHHGLVRR